MKTVMTRQELDALHKKQHEAKTQRLISALAQTVSEGNRVDIINRTATEMQILNEVYYEIMTEFKKGEGNE